MQTLFPQPSIYAQLEQKLSWASACHQEIGQQLCCDPLASALLGQFAAAIADTTSARNSAGVALQCLRCHQDGGGTCCGSGIDEHHDALLLLVNLLLGAQIPPRRAAPEDCRFLGPAGCTLRARQVLCLNHICREAEDRVAVAGLASLRNMEGIEIMAQHRLLVRLAALAAATRFH